MFSTTLYTVIIAVLWAFLVTVFAIPSIIWVAKEKHLFDRPGTRTFHKSPIPRLGGLAIYAGFVSALTIFPEIDLTAKGIQQVLAGTLLIFFIGLKDDVVSVSAFKKFFVQLLACGIVMFMGEVRITQFHGLLGLYELTDEVSYLISFVAIIGLTNAINLIDGLDGLAGTIVLIASLVFGSLFLMQDSYYAMVGFCLAGAVAGFLRYNLSKAVIFMGDTGSLVCGFVLSVLAIQLVETSPMPAPPIVALAVLIIPVVDTLRVFALRAFMGRSPFSPDMQHIHHVLVRAGLRPLGVVSVLALLNLALISATLLLQHYLPINQLLLALLGVCLVVVIIIEVLRRRYPYVEKPTEAVEPIESDAVA